MKHELNDGLVIKSDDNARRGGALKYELKFDAFLDTVAHVSLVDPSGLECHAYKSNQILRNGSAKGEITFALNDKRGKWKLIAKEVVTGKVTEKTFVLE